MIELLDNEKGQQSAARARNNVIDFASGKDLDLFFISLVKKILKLD